MDTNITLETQAQQIIGKINPALRIYIPHAINEMNKQLEEFEKWKQNLPLNITDVLSILPEFNMERNMPVEDDDNLIKMEEW